mgnify:CR=1 FL=1
MYSCSKIQHTKIICCILFFSSSVPVILLSDLIAHAVVAAKFTWLLPAWNAGSPHASLPLLYPKKISAKASIFREPFVRKLLLRGQKKPKAIKGEGPFDIPRAKCQYVKGILRLFFCRLVNNPAVLRLSKALL